jgi:hypothetical protein
MKFSLLFCYCFLEFSGIFVQSRAPTSSKNDNIHSGPAERIDRRSCRRSCRRHLDGRLSDPQHDGPVDSRTETSVTVWDSWRTNSQTSSGSQTSTAALLWSLQDFLRRTSNLQRTSWRTEAQKERGCKCSSSCRKFCGRSNGKWERGFILERFEKRQRSSLRVVRRHLYRVRCLRSSHPRVQASGISIVKTDWQNSN